MFRFCWILRKGPEEGEREILPSESEYWHRNLVPFHLNNIQSNIEDNLGQKNIFLKPRQGGYTTYMIIRRLYMPCVLEPGSGGLLISQNSAYASAHFRILKRVNKLFACKDPFDNRQNQFSKELHENLLHTTASNRRELIFDQLDTAIRCASAEVEEVGQGLTLQHVVCTEVARWEGNPEATLANMKEAIPKHGTLDMESTANGFGGYFFEECMRARDTGEGKVYREFKYHFHEWWWHDEYRRDPAVEEDSLVKEEHRLVMSKNLDLTQIAWRRIKKEELRGEFDEKYPEDDITCVYGNSVVVLADGSTKPISELVNKKYKGKVLTLAKDGKLTTAEVTGWYRTPRKGRRIYKLTYANAPNANNTKAGVILTEEHKVLTFDGWKRVDECNGLHVATGTLAPGPRAFQVILGTMFGDGGIRNHGSLSCVQVARELVKLKGIVLQEFLSKESLTKDLEYYQKKRNRKKRKTSGFGKYSKKTAHLLTQNLPYFRWLKSKFYDGTLKTSDGRNTKNIPVELAGYLDDFGIAVWFMDDGWTNLAKCKQSNGSRPDAGIALGLVSQSVGDKLATILTAKGYDCTCQGKRFKMLKFSCDGTNALLMAIGKYVPSCMRYKLLPESPKFEMKWWKSESTTTFFDKAIVKEINPPMQKGKYEKGPYYCIDVKGTHNFVTLGGVVHNCFLLTGSQYFDRDILRARHMELTIYVPREKYNKLVIFKKERPHRNYVIGADVAEGLEVGTNKRDWSAAAVIDEETGEQVAAYREQLIPEEYGWDLADLGHRYNDALIGVERNEDGGSVILTLEVACMYGNLYKHRDWWKKDWKRRLKSGQSTGQGDQFRMREILGFPTTKKTRPLALNRIRYFISENPELLYDAIFIQECLTFIRNQDKRGRPEAADGCHDDTVMANAIAQYIRHVRLGYLVPEALPHRERYGQTPMEFAEDEPEEPVDPTER